MIPSPFSPAMISALRAFCIIVFLTMLAVTGWASSVQALWKIPAEVIGHPWFIATLFDTYFAFLFFWCWLAWRERTWPVRLGWLLGILLLGNLAMAGYVLIQLFRLPPGATAAQLFQRRHD